VAAGNDGAKASAAPQIAIAMIPFKPRTPAGAGIAAENARNGLTTQHAVRKCSEITSSPDRR